MQSSVTLQIEQKDDITHVLVQGDVTIYAAAELNGLLIDVLTQHTTLHIDLSHVCEVDSAGIQVLFFIQEEAARQQKMVSYCHIPVGLVDLLQLYNLTTQFSLIG